MDAKITNSNENKANPVNYSTQGFTGDPSFRINIDVSGITLPNAVSERECKRIYSIDGMQIPNGYSQNVIINVGKYRKSTVRKM